MKIARRIGLALVVTTGLLAQYGGHAQAQVNRAVSGSSYAIMPKLPTYHVAFTVTPAATPTDVFTLSPGAGKNVAVNRIECTASASTAGFMPISLVLRSTADAGGTSTTVTPISAAAGDGAASATARVYTANPTSVGTLTGAVRTNFLAFPTSTSGYGPLPVTWPFGLVYSTKRIDVVKGTTNNLALNLGGGAVPAGGVVACSVEFQEY